MNLISKRLKELRTDAKESQSELAKIIGVSKSSVNMYERGAREPSNITIEAIADHYNVDIDYLFGKTNIRNKHADECRTPQIPFATKRSIYQGQGIRLMLDADTKMPQKDLDDIVEFIRLKQMKNDRK